MGSLIDNLVQQLGLTPSDILIVIMGIGVVAYIVSQERRHRKELKELSDKYIALNTLSYGSGIAIQAITGISLIEGSANADGEFTLNRNIPTLTDIKQKAQ